MNCSGRLTRSWMQPFFVPASTLAQGCSLGFPRTDDPRPEDLEQSAGWCQAQAHSMAAEPSLGSAGQGWQFTAGLWLQSVHRPSFRGAQPAAHRLRGPPSQPGWTSSPLPSISLPPCRALVLLCQRHALALLQTHLSKAHSLSHPLPFFFLEMKAASLYPAPGGLSKRPLAGLGLGLG